MTRYGVMKHLSVLESAGLVTVRRRGRERWNHLNAVPLRQIYRRWVGKYQELWSSNLLQLKDALERPGSSIGEPRGRQPQGDATMKQTRNGEGLDSFHIAQEVTIEAPREAVWKALTGNIGQWWAFRLTDESAEMSLDARIGGIFMEHRGNGEGAIWGTVIYLKKAEILRLSGPLGMIGRAVNSVYCYELEDRAGNTLIKLTHSAFGDIDPEHGPDHEKGWRTLLDTYLKGYLEDGATWRDIKARSSASSD